LFRTAIDVNASYPQGSRVWTGQCGDRVHERRLPGAVGTGDSRAWPLHATWSSRSGHWPCRHAWPHLSLGDRLTHTSDLIGAAALTTADWKHQRAR